MTTKTRSTRRRRPATAASMTKEAKPLTAAQRKEHENILGRAMIVYLAIRRWRAQRYDKKAAEAVANKFSVATDTGSYLKKLFGTVEELERLRKAGRAIKTFHKAETLPWGDNGERLLPTANYDQYAEGVRERINEFHAALDAFLAVYPKLVNGAKMQLAGLFNPADYPTVQSLRQRYRVDVQYSPLPAAGDFRVTLPKEELQRVQSSVNDRVTECVTEAMDAAWSRLGTVIERLQARIKDDGKHLRQPLIDSLVATAEAMGRLNVVESPELEAARKRVLEMLKNSPAHPQTFIDAETIREDVAVRERVGKDVSAIMKSMEGLYTPRGEDEDEDE